MRARWAASLLLLAALACSNGGTHHTGDARSASAADVAASTDVAPSLPAATATGDLAMIFGLYARKSACGHSSVSDRLDDEVEVLLGTLAYGRPGYVSMLRCLSQAATCDAYMNCAYGAVGASCTPGAATKCQGDRVVECVVDGTGSHERGFDCASTTPTPGTCRVVGGKALCGGPACTASGCSGDSLQVCAGERGALQMDCRYFGTTCVTEGGEPGCGAACVSDRCDGSVAERCLATASAPGKWATATGPLSELVFARRFRFDCASFGAGVRCAVDSNGHAACAATSSDCDPADEPTCQGDSVVVCLHGRRYALDCSDISGYTCGAVKSSVGCVLSPPPA